MSPGARHQPTTRLARQLTRRAAALCLLAPALSVLLLSAACSETEPQATPRPVVRPALIAVLGPALGEPYDADSEPAVPTGSRLVRLDKRAPDGGPLPLTPRLRSRRHGAPHL